MANKILMDTSVLVRLQKGDEETREKYVQNAYLMEISRISAIEFVQGARNKKEQAKNKEFLRYIPINEITEEISALTQELIEKYSLKAGLGLVDAIIAATAAEKRMGVWTYDTKHFGPVEEIELWENEIL